MRSLSSEIIWLALVWAMYGLHHISTSTPHGGGNVLYLFLFEI